MHPSIRIDNENRLVIATLAGPFGVEDVLAIVGAARTEAHRQGYSILYDMSQAQPDGISMSDLFWMPRRLPELVSAAAVKSRAALVHPPQFADFARFWETTFTNSGLRARAFLDRDEALGWLSGS